MTRIIVVRHGQTVENTKWICQGQTEGSLSEHGKKENKILAEKLGDIKINKIYTSPLIRAFETAKEIYKYHQDIEFQKDTRLFEWDMGVLQGNKFPEDFDPLKPAEGMENCYIVHKRLKSFLDEILPLHNNQTIVLVSHGLTIKVLITMLKNIAVEEMNSIKLMGNSSFEIFDIDYVNL